MQGIDDIGAGGLDLNGANGEETFIRIAAAAQELGFEFCTHGLRFAIPVTRPRTTFLSTYPP
ncbi:MAG TPA: hypothetical protein VIN58_17795, partial [Roseateles sp.]